MVLHDIDAGSFYVGEEYSQIRQFLFAQSIPKRPDVLTDPSDLKFVQKLRKMRDSKPLISFDQFYKIIGDKTDAND